MPRQSDEAATGWRRRSCRDVRATRRSCGVREHWRNLGMGETYSRRRKGACICHAPLSWPCSYRLSHRAWELSNVHSAMRTGSTALDHQSHVAGAIRAMIAMFVCIGPDGVVTPRRAVCSGRRIRTVQGTAQTHRSHEDDVLCDGRPGFPCSLCNVAHHARNYSTVYVLADRGFG